MSKLMWRNVYTAWSRLYPTRGRPVRIIFVNYFDRVPETLRVPCMAVDGCGWLAGGQTVLDNNRLAQVGY